MIRADDGVDKSAVRCSNPGFIDMNKVRMEQSAERVPVAPLYGGQDLLAERGEFGGRI